MRERNWPQYNKQLVQRGSLTFLIDPKMLESLKLRPKKGKRGRPAEFSDTVMLLLFMVKIQYRLTYRSLEGFCRQFLGTLYPWLQIPNYSLVCKRAKKLGKILPKLGSGKSTTVLLDASGLKVLGEGEWKVKIHGKGRPRKWIKIHIAVDLKTQEIVAEETTASGCVDSKMTKNLLAQSGKRVKMVIADGAYDRAEARDAIHKAKARALIPPPRNAKVNGSDIGRDQAVLQIIGLGRDKEARSLWGKLTGYSQRALVETAFSRLKRSFGPGMFSQTFDRQKVECRMKCYLLNKMRMPAA